MKWIVVFWISTYGNSGKMNHSSHTEMFKTKDIAVLYASKKAKENPPFILEIDTLGKGKWMTGLDVPFLQIDSFQVKHIK